MHSYLFKSHLIRHLGMVRAFKDTQRALKHLKYLEGIQVLEHSEDTRRTHRGHSESTWALGVHSGTEALKALKHLDNYGT